MQGLRLGTRGSPLALAQARKVAAAIETAQRWPDGWVQIVEIKTTGDAIQDRPLAEIGGKALWTKELDRALLENEVDFCVHSMKDVESHRPGEIHIAAVRPRGDVRDRLIGAKSIDALGRGARVGIPRRDGRRSCSAFDRTSRSFRSAGTSKPGSGRSKAERWMRPSSALRG